MLWAIAVILIILWLLGLVSGYTMGYFVHILVVIAIIAMLLQVEDDCSDYGSGLTSQKYLKRQFIRRSRNILPKIALLAGEKFSQPSILPKKYREE